MTDVHLSVVLEAVIIPSYSFLVRTTHREYAKLLLLTRWENDCSWNFMVGFARCASIRINSLGQGTI